MVLEHKHLLIRAEIEKPPHKEDLPLMRDWFFDLVHKIDMKILMGPYVIYHDMEGNRGFTGVCIIETSHIAMHVWDEEFPGMMQLDVYTCGSLDIEKVFKKIQVFRPTKIDFKYIDREHDFTEIEKGRR